MFAATRQHCRYAANRPIHALGQNIRVDLAVPYRTQFGKSHRHDFIADLGPFSGQPQGQKIAYFVQARVVALNDSVMQPSDMRLEARLSSQSRAISSGGVRKAVADAITTIPVDPNRGAPPRVEQTYNRRPRARRPEPCFKHVLRGQISSEGVDPERRAETRDAVCVVVDCQ